jgi:ribonuclease D
LVTTATIVSDTRELEVLAERFSAAPAIGVDTESDSFHAYREKVCLLQISTEDADFLVDPIVLPDLAPLRTIFADRRIRKVFHAADNDVAGLRRDFNFDTRNLFDTMAASRILGLPRYGLGDLLLEHFGVESDKRLQRYEWGRRPLSPLAVDYAATDSRHLIRLMQILQLRLEEEGRTAEAEEEFLRLESATVRERLFDPEGWRRIKGTQTLAPIERAVLRELYVWRDGQAASLDRPPFRVAPDAALVALAVAQPRDAGALSQVSGLPDSIAQRYGSRLLAAVARGLEATPPEVRRSARPDDAVVERYEALRRWRRLKAGERGVQPDVIVSNAVLQSVAEQRPYSIADLAALGVLGPWKLETYGSELIEALGSTQPGPLLTS